MGTSFLSLCVYPEVRFRIARHFVKNPEIRQNQTEIARSIGLPQTAVSRYIRDLVELRVLFEERHGKSALYSLNSSSLLVTGLIAKIVELDRGLIPDWVKKQMGGLPVMFRNQLDLLILFGSAARGEVTVSSDIDLLAVAPKASEDLEHELQHRLVATGAKAGISINLMIETTRQFGKDARTGYLSEAKAEGIVVWSKG